MDDLLLGQLVCLGAGDRLVPGPPRGRIQRARLHPVQPDPPVAVRRGVDDRDRGRRDRHRPAKRRQPVRDPYRAGARSHPVPPIRCARRRSRTDRDPALRDLPVLCRRRRRQCLGDERAVDARHHPRTARSAAVDPDRLGRRGRTDRDGARRCGGARWHSHDVGSGRFPGPVRDRRRGPVAGRHGLAGPSRSPPPPCPTSATRSSCGLRASDNIWRPRRRRTPCTRHRRCGPGR